MRNGPFSGYKRGGRRRRIHLAQRGRSAAEPIRSFSLFSSVLCFLLHRFCCRVSRRLALFVERPECVLQHLRPVLLFLCVATTGFGICSPPCSFSLYSFVPIAGCISLFVYWLVESSTYSFVVPTCAVVYTHSLFVGPCPCAIIGSLRNRFPVSVGSLSFPSFACSSVQDPRGPASFHHALANNPDILVMS